MADATLPPVADVHLTVGATRVTHHAVIDQNQLDAIYGAVPALIPADPDAAVETVIVDVPVTQRMQVPADSEQAKAGELVATTGSPSAEDTDLDEAGQPIADTEPEEAPTPAPGSGTPFQQSS